MKRPATYLVSVILTLLLIFTALAAMGACVVRKVSLETDTALTLVQTQSLADRVHSALETEFRQKESTTGIPAELYAESITAEVLEPIIRDTVTNGFAYLRGETATLGVSPDFSALETALRDFFADYAAQNDLEQGALYDNAVRATIDDAERTILLNCDVFRFGTLNEAGVFRQAKQVIPWAGAGAIVLLAVSAVLAALLFSVNRREPWHGCYWVGTALLIASLLLLIPSVYLQATRWFDRFAVKTDQTFAAVTGYLYANTHALIVTAIAGIITAALLYVIFALIHAHRRKREIMRNSKH